MRNRRIALKASVPFLAASVALGLTLPARLCAGSLPVSAAAIAIALPGQMGTGNSARRAADDLLRESRSAIKRGDFQRAESLIADAEKLGVKYDPLMDRWSDTPDSMRKLLAAERSKANSTK